MNGGTRRHYVGAIHGELGEDHQGGHAYVFQHFKVSRFTVLFFINFGVHLAYLLNITQCAEGIFGELLRPAGTGRAKSGQEA